jgi:ATP-dependent Clp protease protease subunit
MADTPVASQAQTPNEIYGLFAGAIDQLTFGKLANVVAIASSNNVTHIHLAFQTAGGTIGDGVALYNLFRAIPTHLTLYNIGSVSSAGVLAFLGAPNRAASKHAMFMIHRTMSPAIGVTSDRLHAIAHSVLMDDARIEAIFLAAELKIDPDQRAVHRVADLWLSADEAKEANLVTELREFAPPKGTQLFFVGNS